jgi:uncharacterized repeat protein (TIGR01451 family)
MADITGDGINDIDITTAGSSTTIGGVIFTDAVNVGSGTGNYNTFLAISNNSGVETGFNSDDTPPIDGTNHDIDQAKTHTVLLSDLVIVTVNGQQYYQVRVDLNEANSDPNAQISLDQFKVYTSTDGGIVSTTDLFANATLKYDMDAGGNVSVLLSDAESSGSGTDDYSVLIPVSTFAGQDPTTTYVYFDIQMGAAGTDWGATATFEEWNLENGVALTGLKFEDANNNGVQDAGEDGVAGVTIFIDANKNGALDAGERTTITDADGNYTFFGVALNQTVWIDEVIPAGATQTTGDHEEVIISSNATGTIVVDPIGNFLPHPALSINKDASVPGDCADTVGELVTYTVTVGNAGNVALDNVVLTDSLEGGLGVTLTVTGDTNTDGIVDGNEVWLSGDTGSDGILGVGETWTYQYAHAVTQADIDSNGGDDDGSLDNVATANATAVNGGAAADEVSDDASVEVCQLPALSINKDASVPGDCADTVGELVAYTVTVGNAGNIALDNVVLTDSFEGGLGVTLTVTGDTNADGIVDGNEVWLSGDTGSDGILGVGETWTYQYAHAVTQDDIDTNGGDNDGSLDNVATANATAINGGPAADEVSDDASVEVCPTPAVDITKYVDVGFGWDDANTGPGPQNVSIGTDVDFKLTVANTGNVTLTDVDITDTNLTNGAPGTANLLVDDGVLTAYAIAHGAVLTDDAGNDGILGVGETWTITYTSAFDPGEHLNTADVNTAQGVTDEDSAYYFSLVDEGLCPRTPGFWQNPKNGGQFWDGIQGNEKNAGAAGFPDGELLYAVDSNNNGSIGAGDVAGLLIGDYNHNGLTDVGEDTLFVSYANARSLINSSNKQLNGLSGDGKFILGRDMVASWLNELQGSGFGDASDPQSPHHYLDDAIDWMQIYSGTTNGGTTETFDTFKLLGSIIKTSSAIWNTPVSGIDHSASQMHSALDYYNNTGQTQPGGTNYANCESQHLFEALSIYQQSHELI